MGSLPLHSAESYISKTQRWQTGCFIVTGERGRELLPNLLEWVFTREECKEMRVTQLIFNRPFGEFDLCNHFGSEPNTVAHFFAR